jgi:signal transduction histidine kinase
MGIQAPLDPILPLLQDSNAPSILDTAYHPKIFQPFFTTKPAGEGSGLGLSIASKIIEKHCGKVAVKINSGNTTFKVSLPLNFQLLSLLDVK